VSVRSSSREHGGQNSPDPLVSGWLFLAAHPLWVMQTQLQRMEGATATSVRLTRGCGSLGVAKPRLGGLTVTVEETFDRKEAASKESDKCGKETCECRKGDHA
jgi:hypothetical protein